MKSDICHVGVLLKMLCTPLYPMVLLIIIPMKNGYFIGNIPYFQTNPCYVMLDLTMATATLQQDTSGELCSAWSQAM